MSALTLRLHKIAFHSRPKDDTEGKSIGAKIAQAAWFTLAFLLSVAAGPFAAIGVMGAVFSLANMEGEEPLAKEA